MVKLQKSNERYSITVPKGMVAKKDWEKGEDLCFLFNERGNIEITDEL